MEIPKRARVFAAAAITLATSGCLGSSGGTTPTPPRTTASLTLHFKFPSITSTAACGPLRGTFALTPQSLDSGAAGVDHALTRSFDGIAGVKEGAGTSAYCRYTVLAAWGRESDELRPGVWRVEVAAGARNFSCTERFTTGAQAVFFTAGRAGCSRGGFPL